MSEAIDGTSREASDITSRSRRQGCAGCAIIVAGQAVEHNEITRYGSLFIA
jgi:ferritin-like metal-binding protein YciE